MSKPTAHYAQEAPARNNIQWKSHQDDLDAFVLEVLETLKTGRVLWYPLTTYTLRLIQAARWRLWRLGCALRTQGDVGTDRVYVWAAWTSAQGLAAWKRVAAQRGQKVRALRVLSGGKGRKRSAA